MPGAEGIERFTLFSALKTGTMNQPNHSLLDALNACVAACERCASACLQEEDVKMMARCIALDFECADICQTTAASIARGGAQMQAICALCASACRDCAAECGKHDMDHCKRCAEACTRCVAACLAMAD